MNNKKYVAVILTLLFIGAAGILYSLEVKENSSTKITLNNNELGSEQTGESDVSPVVYDEDNDDDSQEVEKEHGLTDQEGLTTSEEMMKDSSDSKSKEESLEEDPSIYVHICGQVNHPGVYHVKASARVIDLIDLAGGMTKDAAGDSINQAQMVYDGQKVYIPSLEEIKEQGISMYVANENGIVTPEEEANNGESSNNTIALININTASLEELMTLTGIGTAKAESIIKYRENNGPFESIEEIKNIEGIKDGVFKKICDRITI